MQAGWDESKVNVTERDFDRMTWKALQDPSIAEKAALHAHAMNAALIGQDFVIPPGPGVSFYAPGMACLLPSNIVFLCLGVIWHDCSTDGMPCACDCRHMRS